MSASSPPRAPPTPDPAPASPDPALASPPQPDATPRIRALKGADTRPFTFYAKLPEGVPAVNEGFIEWSSGAFIFHPTMIELTEDQVNASVQVRVPSRPRYWSEDDRRRMEREGVLPQGGGSTRRRKAKRTTRKRAP